MNRLDNGVVLCSQTLKLVINSIVAIVILNLYESLEGLHIVE